MKGQSKTVIVGLGSVIVGLLVFFYSFGVTGMMVRSYATWDVEEIDRVSVFNNWFFENGEESLGNTVEENNALARLEFQMHLENLSKKSGISIDDLEYLIGSNLNRYLEIDRRYG